MVYSCQANLESIENIIFDGQITFGEYLSLEIENFVFLYMTTNYSNFEDDFVRGEKDELENDTIYRDFLTEVSDASFRILGCDLYVSSRKNVSQMKKFISTLITDFTSIYIEDKISYLEQIDNIMDAPY
ncbi:hypothetical protein OAG24_00960 [bacterium]|nr:hypothetical protein [bacterium]